MILGVSRRDKGTLVGTGTIKWLISVVGALAAISFIVMGLMGIVNAATVTYSFSSDTAGSAPANISVATGSLNVANVPALGGNALTVSSFSSGSSIFTFNNFPASDDQEVTWRAVYTNAEHRGGIILRHNYDGTDHNGYIFQVNPGAAFNNVRIYRYQGSSTQLGPNFALPGAGVGNVRYYRAVAEGTTLSFYWSADGSAWNLVGSVTDTVFASGGVGWRDWLANSGANRNYMDDFTYTYDNPVVAGLTIESPSSYQVFQRNGSNQADIRIEGTYTGTMSAIEARWNGGPWTTIDSSPSGGTYTGVLLNQAVGQGALDVREVGNPASIVSHEYVGVGDIYVMAGQSNMSGRGFNNQSYSHPTLRASLFGNDDNWKELTDPYDSQIGQIDSVSSDTQAQKGSFVPLLATHILQETQVPVAFIPVARGATSITQWNRSTSVSTLYGSMMRRINEVGPVKAVLWFQGEANGSMTPTQYEGYLSSFANNIASDFGGIPTIPTIIGSQSANGTGRGNVRIGTIQAIDNNPNILMGPAVYDVNIDDEGADGTHFMSDSDLQTLAYRWWKSLDRSFYGGENGWGPRLVSASYYRDIESIELRFNSNAAIDVANMSAVAETFVVSIDGVEIPVSSVEQRNNSTIRLILSGVSDFSEMTISYGYENRLTIEHAVYDSDGLPAIPFLNTVLGVYDIYDDAVIPPSTGGDTDPTVGGTNEDAQLPVSAPSTGVYTSALIFSVVGLFLVSATGAYILTRISQQKQ